MKIPRKKKLKIESPIDDVTLDDADDTRPVRFEALAELTSSEVVAEVKMGMSQIAPIGELDDETFDVAADDDLSEEEAA